MKNYKKFIYRFKNFEDQFYLLKNSSILSIPSLIGVFLALLSIPIHLQINGKQDYGNYIFFHFFFSFGLLLNFGINKITTIEIAKKKDISAIVKQSINYSFKIILIIFTSFFILNFTDLKFENIFLLATGLCLTIVYFNLEGILQGFEKFKLLSIFNFIFFTLSLNFPSIVLLINDNFFFEDLILISILIKFFSILLILYYLKKYLLDKNSTKYDFSSKLKKYSKWYFIHFSNIQIFDFMDKYLIKIFLGPVSLAMYSIPYQLAGKITILSKSLAAVLLPNISLGNETKKFNYSIKLYVFVVPLILLLIFPILEEFLKFWLKNQYSLEILVLTKIFLIVSWISGISHILIAFFEGKENIKFNTILELYLIIPFLSILFLIIILFKDIIFISFILLFKEVVLIFIRSNKLKKNINNLFVIQLNIFFVIFNALISIYFTKYFFFTLLLLVTFNLLLIRGLKK